MYIIEIEMSNGFEYYNNVSPCPDRQEAERCFAELSLSMQTDYPEEYWTTVLEEEHLQQYSQDRGDMSGNGHAFLMCDDHYLFESIYRNVAASDETAVYEYVGVDSAYRMDAKCVTLTEMPEEEIDGVPYRAVLVLRRPYCPEQPDGDEWLCDVVFEGNDCTRRTESVEDIPSGTLIEIFKQTAYR